MNRKFLDGDIVYTRDGFLNVLDRSNNIDKYGGFGYKEGLRLVVKSSMHNETYTDSYRFEEIEYAIYEKALMSEREYLYNLREEKLEELLR
jgi:hypothetical protein